MHMEEECLITKYYNIWMWPLFCVGCFFCVCVCVCVCETALYLTTLTTDRHPCLRWDSNPQSQQASGCILTPYTVQPLVPPDVILSNQNNPLSSKMWLSNVYVGGKFHRTFRTEWEHSQSTAFSYDFFSLIITWISVVTICTVLFILVPDVYFSKGCAAGHWYLICMRDWCLLLLCIVWRAVRDIVISCYQ
jgi:hypothetical protein